jgi:glycosyltransferase involved in cell wall biosynthesis
MTMPKPKLLIFIVAYQAEFTIAKVLSRIPKNLKDDYDPELLIIDDASKDRTFEVCQKFFEEYPFSFKATVLFNPVNQGYGGNQKIGYHYAIQNQFSFVALIHGDGQYAPECLIELLEPLKIGGADAVFGSRMLERGQALAGGMPLYKYVGNKILTWYENKILGINLSEFHSGYRLYSVNALRKVPFFLNTNDFHFDTEIIVQLVFARLRIAELPIPTYYGDEICRVNGMKYAMDVVVAVTLARLQTLQLFYTPMFDCIHNDIRKNKAIPYSHRLLGYILYILVNPIIYISENFMPYKIQERSRVRSSLDLLLADAIVASDRRRLLQSWQTRK